MRDRLSVAGVAGLLPELEHRAPAAPDWSRNGTWERIADRLRGLVRELNGRDADASAGVIDARSVRGASTVTGLTRGYDAGKKISERKTFGIVDSNGLLLAVHVMPANTSDNQGGIAVIDLVRAKTARFAKVRNDAGFKTTFTRHCRHHHIASETVNRIRPHAFVALPRRWVVGANLVLADEQPPPPTRL